jgi:predicted ATPase with chaperone activity
MAPADLRKEGSAYDLTIAVGILAASSQITSEDVRKLHHYGRIIARWRFATHKRSFVYCN